MPAKGQDLKTSPAPRLPRISRSRRDPMNKPITAADFTTPKVTTGPLPASRKVYVAPDEAPDLRVPVREIALTQASPGPPLPVYDTTGVYTAPHAGIDVEAGLKRPRIEWVRERGGVEEY